MPHRQNDLVMTILTADEPIEFSLRPFLGEEPRAQHDNAEPRSAKSNINLPPETITKRERELVIPYAPTAAHKLLSEGPRDALLIFGCVRYEHIPHGSSLMVANEAG